MPLIVHSIWRAPCAAPAIEFAVDSPRSFWQCVLKTTRSAFSPKPSRSCWMSGPAKRLGIRKKTTHRHHSWRRVASTA